MFKTPNTNTRKKYLYLNFTFINYLWYTMEGRLSGEMAQQLNHLLHKHTCGSLCL